MIRLSRLSALRITTTVSKDLDAVPLYLYEFNISNQTQRQFVQDDTTEINSREFAYGPYIQNIWLNPTPTFYPDEEIAANFHTNANLQVILQDNTLPLMQYQNVELLFSQGFGYDSIVRGSTIRAYVKLNNGREVTLASIYDLAATSKITAADQTLFDGQIFNTKLGFQIPDIDYILNSVDAEINALRARIFGDERPTKIFFSYSALRDENIDQAGVNGNTYTQFNLGSVNENSIDFALQNATDVFASLAISPSGRSIVSRLINSQFDVESYLNRFKGSEETYTVTHQFQSTMFNALSNPLGTVNLSCSNPVDKFGSIDYRPLLLDETDHFTTSLTISVRNDQTGLAFTKTTVLNIVEQSTVDNFVQNPSAVNLTLSTDSIYNRLEQVNNIVSIDSDTPDVIQITKPIYVNIEQAAATLTLLPATFTAKVMPNIDLANVTVLFLRIDNLTVQNVPEDLTTFTIPAKAYQTASSRFFLLNSANEVIQTGALNKA